MSDDTKEAIAIIVSLAVAGAIIGGAALWIQTSRSTRSSVDDLAGMLVSCPGFDNQMTRSECEEKLQTIKYQIK